MLLIPALTTCTQATPEANARALLPGGYLARVDSGRSDPGQFHLDQDAQGIHITTGPGGIAWRPADSVHVGDFRVQATLTVMGAPVGYREGYGIFVGGRNLDDALQQYTYLLARPDGTFMVRRRNGAGTETLVDWTPHSSVQRVETTGDAPMNTLAVEVSDGEARFLVNGAVVYRAPLAEARPYGAVGVRINHRLDARLLSWSVGPIPAAPHDTTE